jgi:hypothetical protein
MQALRKRRRWPWLLLALLALAAGAAYLLFDPAKLIASRRAGNDALIREQLAHHAGVLAYLWGYPVVAMKEQMHNETHRIAPDQQVQAPVNRFYQYPDLVTPTTQGNLRAPNHDTLYFSAWYDVSREPLVLHTPDTHDRYFTVAVTNLYSEVTHLGRRTTGTAERYFALVPPDFRGALPEGVTPVPVETQQGWLLGRMLVDGPEDYPAARALVDGVWCAALSEFTPGAKPADPPVSPGAAMDVLHSLSFFEVLHAALRELPPREGETALLAQLAAIGLDPARDFSLASLDDATRSGLERALEDGQAIVRASTQHTIPSFNGWMISDRIGRYGFDYVQRASVVAGGFGNLPEESLYPAAVFDDRGELFSGSRRYRLTFPKGQLPPVGAFWSLTVYDTAFKLVENPIQRYSIGDRTRGLRFAPDGSLAIALQHEAPSDPDANWLPTPSGTFFAVMRLYEPSEAALSHAYQLPRIEQVE